MSSVDSPILPFTSIVGQHQMRHALVLAAINPRIGGVLLRGEKGTAKSTVVRALARLLPARRMATLALGSTEDRIIGGIDLERTLSQGAPVLAPGMLAELDGGLCYIDEVNLLDDHLTDLILDAAANGRVVIERENLSASIATVFSLVGTMNPEEGALRPQLLDRFGLCVEVTGESDTDIRREIIRRQMAFDEDPAGFCAQWKEQEGELADRLATAQALLSSTRIPATVLKLIVELCAHAGVAGHRADLVMAHSACAQAAWNQHVEVTQDDVLAVADMVLEHRRRDHVPQQPQRQPSVPNDVKQPESDDEDQSHQPEDPTDTSTDHLDHKDQADQQDSSGQLGTADQPDQPYSPDDQPPSEPGDPSGSPCAPDSQPDQTEQPHPAFRVKSLEITADRLPRRGSGRRQSTVSADGRGRYVTSRLATGADNLALDATLRAAAPHQIIRRRRLQAAGDPRAAMAVLVERDDWRQAVRMTRVGSAVILVVDASSSMGARGRMAASKGAILSLLIDAYVRRDQVALISFRGTGSQVLVPPTTSVEVADRHLRELPVGGRTPLASGLESADRMAHSMILRQPGIRPLIIVVTDGRGNVGLDGRPSGQATRQAHQLARQLGQDERLTWVVVDSEDPRGLQLHRGEELAEALGALHLKIDELRTDDLVGLVHTINPRDPVNRKN